jgi:prenyl protein peptidase
VAEELTFRAAIISVLRITGGWSIHVANIANALLFAFAHAHEPILRYAQTKSVPPDLLEGTLIQCAFTSLFGFFAGYIFIRSRCIWTCVLVHAICNVVGFPEVDLVLLLPAPILLGLGLVSGITTAVTFYLLRRL